MPWLPTSYGRDPGEIAAAAGMAIHGQTPHVYPNRLAEAIKAIAPGVMAYLKQKKNDEIANQLMNMEHPPRAGAVDPTAYDPSLAASQGLDYQGASATPSGDSPGAYSRDYSAGPAATQPFHGGQRGFQVHKLYQKYVDSQQEDAVKAATEERKARLDEANIARLNAPESGVPMDINGQTYRVTPDAALRHNDARNPVKSAFDKVVGQYGITMNDLAGVDTVTPNVVQYQDESGKKISTEDAAALGGLTADEKAAQGLHGRHAYAVAPGLPRVPLDRWNAAVSLYRNAQDKAGVAPKIMGQQTDAATAPTTDKTPVQVQSVAEADALPSGTYFLTPDGRLKRKP